MARIKTNCSGCRVFMVMEFDGPFTMKKGKINGEPLLCNRCYEARNFDGKTRDMKVFALHLKGDSL